VTLLAAMVRGPFDVKPAPHHLSYGIRLPDGFWIVALPGNYSRQSGTCNVADNCSGPWQPHPRYPQMHGSGPDFCSPDRAGANEVLRLKDGGNHREFLSCRLPRVAWSLTEEPVMNVIAWIVPASPRAWPPAW
jgi:hypothetical protein